MVLCLVCCRSLRSGAVRSFCKLLKYFRDKRSFLTSISKGVTAYCRGETNGKPNGQRVAIQAFLHAAVVVLPAVAIALPKPSPPSWNTGIPTGLLGMANRIVAPVFILLQFNTQIREFRRQNGELGRLSMLSIGLQALVMALVSVRWFVRLGLPHYDRGDVDKMTWVVRFVADLVCVGNACHQLRGVCYWICASVVLLCSGSAW